ncbi:MAG: lactonase family protein [Opitutaceae bacterium]|nr:lactonase family protein [Opitutaceae bacterium]
MTAFLRMRLINPLAGVLALALLSGGAVVGAEPARAPKAGDAAIKDTLAYVGTYTGGQSKGIYLFRLQPQNEGVSGKSMLVPLGLAAETPNPTFLAVDPRRRLLFAVNEIDTFEGRPSGAVCAFAIDPATGKLTLLNQRASLGTIACQLVLDKSGRNLLVANYGSGSVTVLPVQPDGRLGEATAFVQHAGKSINPDRQTGPHAHCVTLDAAERFAFVCVLGLDQILTYRFDAEHGKLTPGNPAFTSVKPGAGPRHMVFRPDGRFAYVINELNSTVTAFAYDPVKGRLIEVETVSSLPPSFTGKNSGAEIGIVPSGKFLYVSNRGNDTVVQFEIELAKGKLHYVREQSTAGRTPRNFGIEPAARYLAVGNQASNTVLVCRIDAMNGRLQPAGVMAEAPSPACIIFLAPAEPTR